MIASARVAFVAVVLVAMTLALWPLQALAVRRGWPLQRKMPLDQPRDADTVAGVIAMLASEDAAHVNGESVRVDGGTLA